MEADKLILAQRGDFSLESAFFMFASSSLDRLSAPMIEQGLRQLGIAISQGDAQLLVKRYDSDQDGKLSFWEFANMFMPVE